MLRATDLDAIKFHQSQPFLGSAPELLLYYRRELVSLNHAKYAFSLKRKHIEKLRVVWRTFKDYKDGMPMNITVLSHVRV
jgi:hypothetical protein